MRGDSHEPWTTVSVPFEAASAGRVRHMMAASLHQAGVPREVIEDAELILSELVSNGLTHGKPDQKNQIQIGWCLRVDSVLVRVCDAGTVSTLRPLELNAYALGGRGLAIVDYVSDDWALDNNEGTRITAKIALP